MCRPCSREVTGTRVMMCPLHAVFEAQRSEVKVCSLRINLNGEVFECEVHLV